MSSSSALDARSVATAVVAGAAAAALTFYLLSPKKQPVDTAKLVSRRRQGFPFLHRRRHRSRARTRARAPG
jgi:hypothetical protein